MALVNRRRIASVEAVPVRIAVAYLVEEAPAAQRPGLLSVAAEPLHRARSIAAGEGR